MKKIKNGKRHNLYSSLGIIRMIKSRMILVGKPQEKRHGTGLDGKLVLKCISET
jgi:hypothetical protein